MAGGNENGDQGTKRREAAIQVALKTGLLKRCPVHGEVYDPRQYDYQGACMVATYLVNRSDPLVAPFLDDRTALTELLKSICHSYATGCSQCSLPLEANGNTTGGTK